MEVNEPSSKYLVRPPMVLTNAGELPADWHVQTLGDLMRLLNGRAFSPAEWSDRGAPIIRIQNLNNFDSEFNFFAGAADERHIVRSGDLLFAWSGTTGSSFGARIWGGPEGVLNQHIFKVIPDAQKISPAYAYRLLLKAQHSIERHAHGFKASFVHVKKSDLTTVPAGYPPTLNEQNKIAEALTDADALIDSLEQLLTKKRQIKQGAMQELLTGKRRLPGFSMAWQLSTVGDEFEIALGKMLDSERNVGLPKPYIGNRAVQWGRIDDTEIKSMAIDAKELERYRLRKGDLLVCEGGEVGRAAIWNAPIDECYYQKALHRLRPLQGYDPQLMLEFLKLWTQSGALDNYVTQTSIAHLPRDKFLEIPLPVPSAEEQAAIAQVLSDMDADIAATEARLTKARDLKQAMAQALLTGRIRLVEEAAA